MRGPINVTESDHSLRNLQVKQHKAASIFCPWTLFFPYTGTFESILYPNPCKVSLFHQRAIFPSICPHFFSPLFITSKNSLHPASCNNLPSCPSWKWYTMCNRRLIYYFQLMGIAFNMCLCFQFAWTPIRLYCEMIPVKVLIFYSMWPCCCFPANIFFHT